MQRWAADDRAMSSPSLAGPRRCWPRCRGSSALPQFPWRVSGGTQNCVAPGIPTRVELHPPAPGQRWPRRLPGWAGSQEWWPWGETGTMAGHPWVLGRSRRAGQRYRVGAGSAVAPSPAGEGPCAPGSSLQWSRATVTPAPSPSQHEATRDHQLSETWETSQRWVPLGNALQCWGLCMAPPCS